MSALLAAAVFVSRPFMRLWASWRQQDLSWMPRPTGAPHAVADGPSADRVLIIGSGPAVGWGVASHDLALAGSLARALRSMTGRGVIVDVIANPEMTAANLAPIIGGARLSDYDAVVTTVGVNDALTGTSPRVWRRNIRLALEIWRNRVAQGNLLLMVGMTSITTIPTFVGRGGWFADLLVRRLNEITDRLADPLPTVRTLPLPAVPSPEGPAGRHTPADYAAWAAVIAHELAGPLDLAYSEHDSVEGRRRSRAVDRMTSGIADAPDLVRLLQGAQASLDKIVTMTAAAMNAPTALVTVLGPDRQWHVARYGIDLEGVPIEQSFCAIAVRNEETLVVPDAPHDPRFASNPLVTDDDGIRYYAGMPLQDPQGRYFGALCVVDSRPRNITTPTDLSVLRKLATAAQSTIWGAIFSDGGRVAHPGALPEAPTSPVDLRPELLATPA